MTFYGTKNPNKLNKIFDSEVEKCKNCEIYNLKV